MRDAWKSHAEETANGNSNENDGPTLVHATPITTESYEEYFREHDDEMMTELARYVLKGDDKPVRSDYRIYRTMDGLTLALDANTHTLPYEITRHLWDTQRWEYELCADDWNSLLYAIPENQRPEQYRMFNLAQKFDVLTVDEWGKDFIATVPFGKVQDQQGKILWDHPANPYNIVQKITSKLRSFRRAKKTIKGWIIMAEGAGVQAHSTPSESCCFAMNTQLTTMGLDGFIKGLVVCPDVSFMEYAPSYYSENRSERCDVSLKRSTQIHPRPIWCIRVESSPVGTTQDSAVRFYHSPISQSNFVKLDGVDETFTNKYKVYVQTLKETAEKPIELTKILGGFKNDEQSTVCNDDPNFKRLPVGIAKPGRMPQSALVTHIIHLTEEQLGMECVNEALQQLDWINVDKETDVYLCEHKPPYRAKIEDRVAKQFAESLVSDLTQMGDMIEKVVMHSTYRVLFTVKKEVGFMMVASKLWDQYGYACVNARTGTRVYINKGTRATATVEPPFVRVRGPIGMTEQTILHVGSHFGKIRQVTHYMTRLDSEEYLVLYEHEQAARLSTGMNISTGKSRIAFVAGTQDDDRCTRKTICTICHCKCTNPQECFDTRQKAATKLDNDKNRLSSANLSMLQQQLTKASTQATISRANQLLNKTTQDIIKGWEEKEEAAKQAATTKEAKDKMLAAAREKDREQDSDDNEPPPKVFKTGEQSEQQRDASPTTASC